MSHRTYPMALVLVGLVALPALAQTTDTGTTTTIGSDLQGVALLTQALAASGAANPIKPVQDFVATGTITYFWAGDQVQGSATVWGRGFDQFRLDASLPEGARSYAISRGQGAQKETDGTLRELAYHNTVNAGILTFPYLGIAAILSDPSRVVSYVGVGQVQGRTTNQIRVRRTFPPATDPDGTLAKLCWADYFIDPQTNLVLKTQDMIHSNNNLKEDFTHEIEFENYTTFNGVNVPTLIREKIIGQTTWELRLTNISFNTGLTDLVFTLQ